MANRTARKYADQRDRAQIRVRELERELLAQQTELEDLSATLAARARELQHELDQQHEERERQHHAVTPYDQLDDAKVDR